MMKFLFIGFTMIMAQPEKFQIFDFSSSKDYSAWTIVDDVVMGGRSDGGLKVSDEGNALFSGYVSLENNGGFSSVRYAFDEIRPSGQTKFMVRVKGDLKNYQFRVKSDRRERHSYVSQFQTDGSWKIIEIPFSDMFPSFRGAILNIPNYPGESMQEISFLISNKVNESFQLEIDRIWIFFEFFYQFISEIEIGNFAVSVSF